MLILGMDNIFQSMKWIFLLHNYAQFKELDHVIVFNALLTQ